jgi:predicted flap endonuclease-1-like 5' DNA nuclease
LTIELPDKQPSDLPSGIGNPARRALAGVGCWRLDQVAELTEAEIRKLHGVGPKAIRVLHSALAARGLSFAGEKTTPPPETR